MTTLLKRHHRTARASAHGGKLPDMLTATKRWEHVTCGTCRKSRKKGPA